MPDFAYGGRDFNVAGADIVVKYRNDSGVLVTVTGSAAIIADTDLHAKIDMSAATVEALNLDYAGGATDPEDTDGNAYKTTWTTGKQLAYDTLEINSNLFRDLGETP